MDDFTTERSFDSQATWVIDVLGLFFDMLYMGVFYNQSLADARSTGAGIYTVNDLNRAYGNTEY